MIIWLHPNDCDPPHSLNLTHGSRDLIKVEGLEEKFRVYGFDTHYPALVGYPFNGRVQLLSGTHRHEAARRCSIKLPVTLFLRSYVEAYWGTDKWPDLICDIPVDDLLKMESFDDIAPGLNERMIQWNN